MRARAADDPASSGLPRRFGKYTLLRRLATGGMAELFLALQRSVAGFEKLVVIKRILPRMTEDRVFIDMLLHEARVAATLSHPNIVQIFDAGQIDGTYFIAMEHVHGEDIRSIARQMRRRSHSGYRELPLEHALSIVQGLCAGLAYAHEKRDFDGTQLNIVHRDVSPQNVVVTFSGDIKIVDFGIAKSDRMLRPDTKSGRLKGKVPYMSPEQARGENLDARSDIFATGVILFELTTGRRLFKTSSEYETLKSICEREYPLPSAVVSDYPPELETIVMRALARGRDDRFQSAREMQVALEDFVRCERMIVSPIGLQHFMHSLFADKLVSQKEALLHGKQLAEAIEQSHATREPNESGEVNEANEAGEKEFASAHLSMPAASHTVTSTVPGSGTTLPWAFAAAAMLAFALGVVLFEATLYVGRAKSHADTGPSAALLAAAAQTAAAAPAQTAAAPADPNAVRAAAPPAAVEPAPELQTVAHVKALARPPTTGTGKLNVAAVGGWCDVAIDGKPFGPTPIAAIELASGVHKVTCTISGGKAQSANVKVTRSGTARHRFDL